MVLKHPSVNNTVNNTNNDNPVVVDNSQVIFYYGETCSFCKIVEAYIENNNFSLKSQIVKKEVFVNQTNAQELTAKAEACGLDTQKIGVPFLWYQGRCIIGDQEIINLFKTTNTQ
ncbi:MAG: hypothetical protein NTW06_01030 [Candidatus Falkowbacteria bacterium]|nr:hypothetical protein [Candidatus Falkowbacteria bacterium]